MIAEHSLIRRSVRRIRRTLKSLTEVRPVQRHENPYATLLPVLTALAVKLNVEHVVEFGCGVNSTLTFLDRGIFPSLDSLVSVENDPQWQEKIEQDANDERLQMISTSGKIASTVTEPLLKNADLILVDDSTCAEDRAATVAAVSKMMPTRAIMVIHDFEVPNYQEAAQTIRHRFVCDAILPNTGVVTSGQSIDSRWFRSVNQRIKKHSHNIAPTETHRWRDVFQSL